MAALIGVLPGDGIGPEVVAEAIKVLEAVARTGGHRFEMRHALIGGAAIDATGKAFPADTRALSLEADAVLLGAVGGPKWSDPAAKERPEQGLLDLRAAMGVYANVRPVRTHPTLYAASPLKPERLQGVDIVVLRELTGGIYFGEKRRTADSASDLCSYQRSEIERLLRMGAQMARGRRRKVTSVDKANVLETSRLWRSVANELFAREFPGPAAGAPAGGCRRHAPAVAAGRFRRDRHGEHVRRHPHGRGLDAGRVPRDAALRFPERAAAAASTSRSTARRPTSPARASPIPAGRFSAWPCCCATPCALEQEALAVEKAVFDVLESGTPHPGHRRAGHPRGVDP